MRDMHDAAPLIIVVYALGGVAVIEAVALVFVWAALTRSRWEAAELRERVDPRTWPVRRDALLASHQRCRPAGALPRHAEAVIILVGLTVW
jgi:hypothetical protein